MFYRRYLDCAREHSDWYVNTPEVNACRNRQPRVIHLRWRPCETNLMKNAVIEFSRYSSMVPYQEMRTTTTRGSLCTVCKTDASLVMPVAETIEVPHDAQNFRIRFSPTNPYTTNSVIVENNAKYFMENNSIYQLYPF